MLPLQGMTVIAVEQYGAGPFGTMFLGDLGADVIKIETPATEGEIGRHVGPYFFEKNNSHFFQSFNRNKRSMTLNLKSEEGVKLFHELVGKADAVINNLRGDLPEKLGLTYESLKSVNPKIVCTHLSAYGREGERKSWPGYDYLMQAETGYLSVTGEPGQPPSRFGLSIVDMMTGLMAAFSLVSGVLGARNSGVGKDLDVSLFDTALQNLTYLATWYLNAGVVQGREPRSSHPSLTPSQLYKTRDGWIFLMCNKEKFWPILADKVGHPEWKDDPRFLTFKERLENRDTLTELLDEALSVKDAEEWIEIFGGYIPASPVYDIGQALETSFIKNNGKLAEFSSPTDPRKINMIASPIKVSGETIPTKSGPLLGEDTDDILRALGYDDARI
ncbi:MAG: CoA transferase, partial [Gammaproteobacteria bacterium]|nr:CoA transferase [Gammaproteobacteria bacterium]